MYVGDGLNDCGTQPVNNRPSGSLGRSVENFSSKVVPGLYRGEIVTKKKPDIRHGEIRGLATTYDFGPRVS